MMSQYEQPLAGYLHRMEEENMKTAHLPFLKVFQLQPFLVM